MALEKCPVVVEPISTRKKEGRIYVNLGESGIQGDFRSPIVPGQNANGHGKRVVEHLPSVMIVVQQGSGQGVVAVTSRVQHQREQLPIIERHTDGCMERVISVPSSDRHEGLPLRGNQLIPTAISLHLSHQLPNEISVWL